jgi:exopolyphosphatase / guanosine-5'-triphosphate,3'-diphosphate pyrophosphatase
VVDERALRVTGRVAGIDCGTNSIRLLITEGGVDVVREMRIVRLGQDVDRTGVLAPEAIERTRLALLDYEATIRASDVRAVRMVATSATRDAANRADFVDMVVSVLGVAPEVITGDEEAALSFSGAVRSLPGLDATVTVADIGGGSTELVVGSLADGVLGARSLDVGCVRMTERHLHDDPPTSAQVAAVEADVRAAVDQARAEMPLAAANSFIGVAGTVTTIVAIALGLERYQAELIHGSTITVAQVDEVTEELVNLTSAARLRIPVMHPGRADVIAGGALVLRTLMRSIDASAVTASEHDILDGIAASIG